MARHQSHLIKFTNIPSRHNNSTTVGIVANQVDGILYLVNYPSVISLPFAPLLAVHGPEITLFVGPFVPNSALVVLQVSNVGVAREEPQEFVNDAWPVYSLRGHGREAV